jgi:DNA-binding response OmpR family regulator
MPAEQSVVYRFAGFEVNPVTRSLKRNETSIELSRRSFDLLAGGPVIQLTGTVPHSSQSYRDEWALR